jgi:hypothetical protein
MQLADIACLQNVAAVSGLGARRRFARNAAAHDRLHGPALPTFADRSDAQNGTVVRIDSRAGNGLRVNSY